MKTTIISIWVAALALTGPVLTGCDSEDGGSYDVTVWWEVSNFPSCESGTLPDELGGGQLLFETVRITVYDREGDEDPYQRPVEVSCEDYSYTLRGLERGSYFVTIEALADYGGDYLPYFQASGEIDLPATDEEEGYTFQLGLGTAAITVAWDFEQGGCGANYVDEIVITLEAEMSSPKNDAVLEDVECDIAGGQSVDGLSWDKYKLVVEGYDGDGSLTHRGEFDDEAIEIKPGRDEEPFWVDLIEL